MSEHRFAGNVSDGQNAGVGSSLFFVDSDEAFFVDSDFCVFEAEAFAVRAAADRNEYSVKRLRRLNAFAFQFGDDPCSLCFQAGDFGVEVNGFELAS